jgi:hypothetical protein
MAKHRKRDRSPSPSSSSSGSGSESDASSASENRSSGRKRSRPTHEEERQANRYRIHCVSMTYLMPKMHMTAELQQRLASQIFLGYIPESL